MATNPLPGTSLMAREMQLHSGMDRMADAFKARVIFSATICVAAICSLFVLWNGRFIVLLLFAGIVGALLLSMPTRWLQTKLRIRRSQALFIVLFSISALLAGLAILRGPAMLQQLAALQTSIPQATQEIVMRLNGQTSGRWLTAHLADSVRNSDGLSFAVSGLRSIMTLTTLTIAGLIVILFTSLFLAAEPDFYLRGLFRLAPAPSRTVLNRCLESARSSLQSWLVAKLLSMVIIGVMVALGLWILRVPLPGTLGVIAGLLTFIPNLGPVLSVVPATLLAFAISPGRGVLTLLLFGLVHFLEGNVVTPLAERKIVTLPPALTLAVQLLLASFTGILGVALAAPITAALLGILNVLLPHSAEPAATPNRENSTPMSLEDRTNAGRPAVVHS